MLPVFFPIELFFAEWRGEGWRAFIDSIYFGTMVYATYGGIIIGLFVIPVSIVVKQMTNKLSTSQRLWSSFFLHNGFAAIPAFFLFYEWMSLAPFFVATIFFIVSEVIHHLHKIERLSRKAISIAILLPIVVWGASGIPTLIEGYEADKELARLKKEGYPQAVILVDGEEYSGFEQQSCWTNVGPPTCRDDFEVMTKTNLQGFEGDVRAEPGSNLRIHYTNRPAKTEVKLIYWDEGMKQEEILSDSEVSLPNQPGLYHYWFVGTWEKMRTSLSIIVEIKE
ncbi:hypothetical protein [Pseudalkalibacillus sp. SCS-8]|uniref:hypothetical protein n=1 Tax=Pseudalkalibacillus nanhaiensis TaxID=3115291 RepID=UPI0032DAF5D0